MNYDIIGDIHGHADALKALLAKLGYREEGGAWRQTDREAIFVGDLIDRGPQQVETVDIVRRMVDAGSAQTVMGNHEFNAIAWHTPHPHKGGEYLRPRHHPKWGEKNRLQHERFLAEVEHRPALHKELIDWFMSLPLWLELPEIRVVHACWHARFMEWLRQHLTAEGQLTPEILEPATQEPEDQAEKDIAGPSLFKAVEAVTKGLEIPLPEPHTFIDKDGNRRRRVRVRWWDPEAKDYPQAAMLDQALREQLPRMPIPDHARINVPTDKPIFFGHYWLTGGPEILAPHAACVDYSAGKGGTLVAYRWDGEEWLDSAKFAGVSARPPSHGAGQ